MTAYKTTPITTSPLFSYDDGSIIVVHNTSGPTFGPMFTEYAIKGRMTVASMVFNELKMMSITKDEIKKALAKTKFPERKKALVAQLKAAKKVLALRKALKAAPPAKKAAILAKIVKAKAALKKANQKVVKVTAKVDKKKIAIIKARIAAATDPKRKKVLVA